MINYLSLLRNLEIAAVDAYEATWAFPGFFRAGTLFENFEKFSEIAKIHSLSIFFKKFNKPSVNFSRIQKQPQIVGKFRKMLKQILLKN